MIGRKKSRALRVSAALVVSMVAALVGCGASNEPGEGASSTAEAISNDLDHCASDPPNEEAHLADYGIGFDSCPPSKTGIPCSAETALQGELQAAGCRRCVNGDGAYYVTRVSPAGIREQKHQWWCAVCPQTPAVNAILSNPNYTVAPLGVRTPRSCKGTDVLRPSGVGWVNELLVEWDPRCPGGACTTPPTGGL